MIHLHVRSSFSLLQSPFTVERIVACAKENQMSHVALTDKNVMYGTMAFLHACKKEGIEPIVGLEIDTRFLDEPLGLILLARNEAGLQNLYHLSTLASTTLPELDFEEVRKYSKDCFVLTTGMDGWQEELCQEAKLDQLADRLSLLAEAFDPESFYISIALQDSITKKEENRVLKAAARSIGLECAALSRIEYEKPEDDFKLRLLRAIDLNLGVDHPSIGVRRGRYFRSSEEMKELYDPEDLENTEKIASQIHLELSHKASLPEFVNKLNLPSDEYLKKLCSAGLKKRLKSMLEDKAAFKENSRFLYAQWLESKNKNAKQIENESGLHEKPGGPESHRSESGSLKADLNISELPESYPSITKTSLSETEDNPGPADTQTSLTESGVNLTEDDGSHFEAPEFNEGNSNAESPVETPAGTSAVPQTEKPAEPQANPSQKEFENTIAVKVNTDDRSDGTGGSARPVKESDSKDFLQYLYDVYSDRLAYELDIISSMGFENYFLIVYDFIRYARSRNILVGPGRGSAAGSLVAYVLGITHIDPIANHLLFERFLNPERISMPDIDTDFPDDRRDEVIAYTESLYGKGHVAHIVTFSTMKARMVLRDVGRATGIPLYEVDQLCKALTSSKTGAASAPLNQTLEQAYHENARFKRLIDSRTSWTQLYERAKGIEGLPRHASLHAGGIVFSREPIEKIAPLVNAGSEIPAVQFTMEYLEELGLIKFDFLGLKNLSALEQMRQEVERETGKSLDLFKVPLDDPKVYALLSRAHTLGVFQLESAGIRALLKDFGPKQFSDIAAVLALYRPGPMKNIALYLNARNNPNVRQSLDPRLDAILAESGGIFLYQEQIMKAAQEIGGFSLAQADSLRKAMSKKNHEIMAGYRKQFVSGAIENNLSEEKALEIFELMERFADYGFNKSHSYAYGLVVYWMAWIKANYPYPFYLSSLNANLSSTLKTSQFLQECKLQEIRILPISINHSEKWWTMETVMEGHGNHQIDNRIGHRNGSRQRSQYGNQQGNRNGNQNGSRSGNRMENRSGTWNGNGLENRLFDAQDYRQSHLRNQNQPLHQRESYQNHPGYRGYPEQGFQSGQNKRRLSHMAIPDQELQRPQFVRPEQRSGNLQSGSGPGAGTRLPALRMPFNLAKGLTSSVAQKIMEDRMANGPYPDIYSAFARLYALDLHKLSKNVYEALIYAGAFDEFGFSRKGLISCLERLIQYAGLVQDRSDEQISFKFDVVSKPNIENLKEDLMEKLNKEKEIFGFYLSVHPAATFRQKHPQAIQIERISKPGQYTILGRILSIHQHKIKKSGEIMAFVNIEDETGTMDLAIMPGLLKQIGPQLEAKDAFLMVQGKKDQRNSLLVNRIWFL